MKRRIFIAIKTSKEIEQSFLDWRENFPNLPVRWIKPKNLHITILPPWYEEELDEAKSKLRLISGRGNPFTLGFSRICYGPHPKKPRLIWAEGPVNRQLLCLKDAIEREFKMTSEPRTTHLHVTLARFNPQDFSRFSVKHFDEKISWRQDVLSVVLMESQLMRDGAEYVVIDEVKL